MRSHRFRRSLRTGVIAFALLAGLATYVHQAATASVNGPTGFGASAVSGYTVSAPQYTFTPDGQAIAALHFTLDAPAAVVQVALVSSPTDADWTKCGPSRSATPYTVSCALDRPVAVADVVLFSVSAASN